MLSNNSNFLIATIITILIIAISTMPPPPTYPIKEMCDEYHEKCQNKLKRSDCNERAEECVKYANQGIQTTWNFCMYSNNFDVTACQKRSEIDFSIIHEWISKDKFEFIPQ